MSSTDAQAPLMMDHIPADAEEKMGLPADTFTKVIGQLPLQPGNVKNWKDVEYFFDCQTSTSCGTVLGNTLCCFTGIGACYLWARNQLVEQGELGFTMNNGNPEVLLPGRHFLASPLNEFLGTKSLKEDIIRYGPMSIIRVPQGQLGFAYDNGNPEIMLPGVHARNNAAFKFDKLASIDQDLISFGPIKLFTVRSGGVRVCYTNGRLEVYPEGRYAVNSGTFVVGSAIDIQQQNLRFEKHSVLLDGGITMLVEGLLTYQVESIDKLIRQLGEEEHVLVRSIKDVTKAELARVFASLHLEQISQASVDGPGFGEEKDEEPSSFLGKKAAMDKESPVSREGQTRMWICDQVIKSVSPIVAEWGVQVINFQLESTKIADERYAAEYEAASLAMAKAKANLRAVNAQNQITLSQAQTAAEARKIEAEGRKNAVVIEAQGDAEARTIEANARNEAAKAMTDDFAKKFALTGQQVEFAKNLKARTLMVVPGSAMASPLVANQMFAPQADN